jgi:hypothetical protein
MKQNGKAHSEDSAESRTGRKRSGEITDGPEILLKKPCKDDSEIDGSSQASPHRENV